MVKEERSIIRNKYTYFPLYDTDKNSFMRRYHLWMKYRDYCVKNNRKVIDVHTFSKIITKSLGRVKEYLVTDPDGVKFYNFKLKVALAKIPTKDNYFFILDKSYIPVIKIESNYKKRKQFSIKYWKFIPEYRLRVKIMNHFKENSDKMFDYEILSMYKNSVNLDFFNDF